MKMSISRDSALSRKIGHRRTVFIVKVTDRQRQTDNWQNRE